MAAWSQLPEELLALVLARFFFPVDRACFQAVCRSWRSVARPPARQLPWIVLWNGGFMTPYDRALHRIVSYPKPITSCVGMDPADRALHRLASFPKTMTCIGSTDGWIAIEDRADSMHRHYFLHNMFFGTTLSLPELDAAIGHVSEIFKINKVLLRSTPDDVIALMTNHRSCPIVLTRLGKGVSLPKYYANYLVNIVDLAFLEDRLYGITQDEMLVFIDITYDDSGVPMVNGGKCAIGEGFDLDDDDDGHDENGGDDGHDESGGDDDDDHPNNEEDGDSSDHEEEYENDDDVDDDDYDIENDGDDVEEDDDDTEDDLTKMTEEDMVPEASQYIFVEDNDESTERSIETMWYLIESLGKLLMVRRQVVSLFGFTHKVLISTERFTHKVEVFEADMSSAMWVPVKEGGLEDQALFISGPFNKSLL